MNYIQKALFLGVFLLILPIISANNEIYVDIHQDIPYIDYTIYYDSNFEMYLPDFQELIYIKGLPELNYDIIDSKLYVYSAKGTLVLKYKGNEFLENKNTLEKTLDFDILNNTVIIVKSDKEFLKINSDYNKDNDKHVYETNEDFVLYLVYENVSKYFNLVLGFVISIILIIIIFSIYFYYKKANQKNNTRFLDINQNNILNLVKNNSLTQQEVANKLNIKKSHMSKILNKMERQDLIERKKIGKINIANKNTKIKSPGMKYKHYSPKAKIILLDNLLNIKNNYSKDKTIIITKHKIKTPYKNIIYQNNSKLAKNIFAWFRYADSKKFNLIIIEKPRNKNLGASILNRLEKAASKS